MPAAPPLVRLRGVCKVFETDDVVTSALAGVDLDIAHGEFVAVTGPSGCGKSTLLSVLGLLEVPTAGSYALEGVPAADLGSEGRALVRNRRIGFVFQASNLLAELTVRENVALPLAYRGLANRERRRRVEHALERVGMTHRARHYPAQLSGGQQQRVAVARAVAGDPLLLLADEPTGNLDSANGDAVMALLRELHDDGTTICIVTHDARYARVAGRAVAMLDGRITADDAR